MSTRFCPECGEGLVNDRDLQEFFSADDPETPITQCPCGWVIDWPHCLPDPGDHFPLMPSLMDTLGAALKESMAR